MSDRKIKFSSRILSGLLAIMMIVFSIPVSMIVFAIGEYDYLEAKNLTAVYDAENDSIIVTWDAIVGDVDSLDVDIDSALGDSVPNVADTTYIFDSTTVSALTGGSHTINLTGSYGTHERTASTTVVLPYNLASVGTVAATNVDNDLTIAEIVAQMPATVELTAETETISANITWNTEGTTYDKSLSTAQSFEVSGTVTLPSTVVNRSAVSLGITGTVNSAAATDIAITTDVATSAEKKVGESLALSVEASGTAPKYQWYKKAGDESEATAIVGETTASLNISSVTLADAAKYYCVVTGKNNSNVTSNTTTVDVAKNNVDIQLSISPSAGQTRPNPIEIEVLNVPNDAKGDVTIKEGDKEIHKVTLDGSNDEIKYVFTATGSSDSFVFSAFYTGDDEKYNANNVIGIAYDFTKGTQNNPTISAIPSNIKALDTFTVTASGVDTANGKYTITVSDTSVAQIIESTDNKATVKVLKKGEFIITAFANGNDDYNISGPTTKSVTADYADRSGLKFNSVNATEAYTSNFSFTMGYVDTSKGDTAPEFSIDWTETTAEGVDIDSVTGRIFYTYDSDSYMTGFKGKVGMVKVVVTKATEGIYKTISDTYTLEITKGTQALLSFSTSTPNDITYTEIDDTDPEKNGTKFTNPMSNTENGTVNSVLSYAITEQKTLENTVTTGVAEITNSSNGEIRALKSGFVKVTATLPGNSMYKEANCSYTIKINRGTIVGFDFAKTSDSFLKTKYGVQFENAASGGQSDASGLITYEITNVSEEIASYTKVSDNGVVYFDGDYACAVDADEYTVTIKATRAENDKYVACPKEYTLKIERNQVDKNNDFKVNGNVIKNTDEWYNLTDEKITVTPSVKYNKISTDGITWQNELEYTEDNKATINFYLKTIDDTKENNGEVTQFSTQKYNFDKTCPEATLTVVEDGNTWINKFIETISFGLWKKESKKIKIDAKDNLSGIMSIEYCEQNADFQSIKKDVTVEDIVKNLEWKTCQIASGDLTANDTIDITLAEFTNKKVVIYAKITDCANNVSYFRSDGMIFDNISPTMEVALSDQPIVNIQLPDTSTEGLYNGDVPFSLTVTDPKVDASGIKNFTVTITGKESDGTEHNKTINVTSKTSEITSFNSDNVDSSKFDVDNTFIVPSEFNSNHITILVEGKDYSENPFDNSQNLTHLAIDVTNPTIDVAYTASSGNEDVEFSNEKYIGNNQNRKATITITELNFDNSAVEVNLKRDGKNVDIAPVFKAVDGGLDSNGDQIKWSMDINYATLVTEDGSIFDFDISYTDKAKNANDAVNYGEYENPQNFIIDNTKPVITVEITNTEVQNEKYFKADRTATVTIKERFFDKNYKFDWSGLTYSLNGTKGTAPTPVSTSSDDNTYIREYKIDFTTEGDYTFDVKYTDLADNLADTYGCNSVAYKEFTVDKTAPTLDITGVADKSANNGTVAPVVTYSDINFDVNTVSVVLTGVNNGTVNYNNTVNNEAQQGSVTYADFERVQNVDDIYTLSAKLTDKAGNETTKSIMFSANRYGSVYNLNSIKELIGKYLQTEQDIVFTETNVDSLEREGIKIKLTKNGTPSDLVEGTDYTVDIAGGNGQWSVYTYTISKKLFANDGRYSVSIYSKDAAGNINENIDETKEAEISFGIDKTKPVIVPIDFESGVQYPVESKTVSIEIKDNLVLDGVKIYLNDKEVKYNVEGETYTFDIPEKNSKQNVRIVAVDAAGNEQELAVTNFLVSTNIFVRWFNNTPLFVGSIAGVVLIAGAAAFFVFRKRRVV